MRPASAGLSQGSCASELLSEERRSLPPREQSNGQPFLPAVTFLRSLPTNLWAKGFRHCELSPASFLRLCSCASAAPLLFPPVCRASPRILTASPSIHFARRQARSLS